MKVDDFVRAVSVVRHSCGEKGRLDYVYLSRNDKGGTSVTATNGHVLTEYGIPSADHDEGLPVSAGIPLATVKYALDVLKAIPRREFIRIELVDANKFALSVEGRFLVSFDGAKVTKGIKNFRDLLPRERKALPAIGMSASVLSTVAKTVRSLSKFTIVRLDFSGGQEAVVLTCEQFAFFRMIAMPARTAGVEL